MSWHTSSRLDVDMTTSLNNRERTSFSKAHAIYSDVMEEFRNNGIDSPYEPEERFLHGDSLSGLGPQRRYLTQKSCPENLEGIYPSAGQASPSSSDSGYFHTEFPKNLHTKYAMEQQAAFTTPSKWRNTYEPRSPIQEEPHVLTGDMSPVLEYLSEEQVEVLSTIPSKALYFLINHFRKMLPTTKHLKDKVCRFCKNNGELEMVFRSHKLRTAGKLTCPVLRHLVCERCGATGDEAHTIKYCTAISPEERKHYELLMQNRRLTMVTRPYIRSQSITTLPKEGVSQYLYSNIPQQWIELEKKLMMQN